MARRRTTKKDTTALDLIDALADVIASRVAAKIIEAEKPASTPERVPMWLMGPKPPRRPPRQQSLTKQAPSSVEPRHQSWTEAETEAMADQAIRGAGGVRMGEPGYQELLQKYLVGKRAHDAELHVKAQMRKAARLVSKLVETAATRREESSPS